MKVAIVHDWLITYGGAERVLAEMLKEFPEADLFALYDFLPAGDRGCILDKPVKISFLQKMPLARTKYRNYLPLMPLAIEQFDLSEYDLIISSSFAVAKGVITGPDQLHICMCYSPIRYAWDLTHQYLRDAGLDRGPSGWITKYLLHRIRIWDSRTAHGVDRFIAISEFIARRIKKVYGRESTVIYPPADTNLFSLEPNKEDYYLTVSRLVPYKKIGCIIDAFAALPDKRLVVIGDGPEFKQQRRKAGRNVEMLGAQPSEVVRHHMQKARAFIFAAEEDFGIVNVEAQACGTPVIAYGKGGSLETVLPGRTGLFFERQDSSSIKQAIEDFEQIVDGISPTEVRANALRFSRERFRHAFRSLVDNAAAEHLAAIRVKDNIELPTMLEESDQDQ